MTVTLSEILPGDGIYRVCSRCRAAGILGQPAQVPW